MAGPPMRCYAQRRTRMRQMNSRPLALDLAASIATLLLAGCSGAIVPEPSRDAAPSIEPLQDLAEADSRPADLYVSPSGEDRATGDSPAQPLRTLGRALEIVEAGQLVLVLPGTYQESLVLEAAPVGITISGIPGESILDGGRRLPVALWCDGCRGLALEGLTVQHYTDAGLVIANSQDIVLRELMVSDSGFDPRVAEWEFEGYGIDIESSTRVVVEASRVARIGPRPQRPGRLMGSSIVAYDCRDCVIRGNTIFENTGGMVIEDSVGVLAEDNLLYSNDLDATAERWWDGAIWLDGGRDVTLRGNTIRDNLGPGLQISDEESAGPTGYVLVDNQVTGNLIGLHLWGFGTSDLPGPPTLRMRGNRITGNAIGDVFVSADWCLPPEPCEEEGTP